MKFLDDMDQLTAEREMEVRMTALVSHYRTQDQLYEETGVEEE